MKRIGFMLCLTMLSACACQQVAQPSRSNPMEVHKALAVPDLIIPAVNLEKVSVFDAVMFLRKCEAEQGNASRTVLSRGITPRTVSIKGSSMTYLAILNAICRQADLTWTAGPKYILIHEKESTVEQTDALDKK